MPTSAHRQTFLFRRSARHTSPTWTLACLMLFSLTRGGICQAQTPPQRLNAKEQEFVSSIERKLVTKLNSKDNPGDKSTWYVLMLRDAAVAASQGTGLKGRRLSVDSKVNTEDNAVVVQGKHDAAIAVARFMVSANTAVEDLKKPRVNRALTNTQVDAEKQWDFRAFASQAEANLFADSLKPEKPAKGGKAANTGKKKPPK